MNHLLASLLTWLCLALAWPSLALAQAGAKAIANYPARPVRLIVPLSPGGGVDVLARIIAQHYHSLWGQPFIVDKRPGAGGNIGYETVAKAQPDVGLGPNRPRRRDLPPGTGLPMRVAQ